MRLLAIETSSRLGSIAIDWEGQLHQAQLENSRAHASDLLPELDVLLQAAGARRVHGVLPFSHIVVGIGPGSYTGLRIGIATARALAWASGAQLIGIPSFEATAFDALGAEQCAAIAQDARAGKFYYARYERELDGLRELAAPQLLDARALGQALEAEAIILGDEKVVESAGLNARCRAKLRTHAWPSASALLCLGRKRMGSLEATPVEPLYLRDFGH